MRTNKKPTRPQWAKKLTAKLWRHLQEGQGRPNPTLSSLKADVEDQSAKNIVCLQCNEALAIVTRGR